MKMHETILNNTWKKIALVMFISGSVLLTLSYYDYSKLLNYQALLNTNWSKHIIKDVKNTTEEINNVYLENNNNHSTADNDDHYLVFNSKCRIMNLDPFSKDAKAYFKALSYKTCTKNELLTYVTKTDNIATVFIDNEIIPQYSKHPIRCCYSHILRGTSTKNPDDSIKITNCKNFQNNITITNEAILIKCFSGGTKIYENVHTSVRVTQNIQKKINNFSNTSVKPLSVLIIGIDSISRLNFIRALPKTYKYVEDNGWISLKGYNKIDDNTFPNLMAILTGLNQTRAYEVCNPKLVGGMEMDKCPMLWYTYKNFNYITAYAEDAASISTFNYIKKGFIHPPTDYYFRPYVMAAEKLNKVSVSSMAYCTGPETSGERILNLVKDFGGTFKDTPNFGFFWMNTFSHNEISTPTMMDTKLKMFLTDLDNSGITNNSLIIFLSDHGIRFGDIRITETGWYEERLPFIYFGFPKWFQYRFPEEYNNFLQNVNKLSTPYDLHMTLQHILVMSELNYTIKSSETCPNCISLFKKLPSLRSCEDAKIAQHWCTCAGYSSKKFNKEIEEKVIDKFLEEIDKIIDVRKKLSNGDDNNNVECAKFAATDISIRISQNVGKNSSNLLVIMKTNPKAVFETTMRYSGNDIMATNIKVGDISRLDYYGPHSLCVSDGYLKKFCYCI